MSKVEVEVYALSDMNTALRKLNESVKQALEQAQRAIEKEKSRLETIRRDRQQKKVECETQVQQCTAQVQQCASALQQCLGQVDEEGRPSPCTGEQQSLRQAEQALREAQQALREAEHALREAENQVRHFNDQADTYLNKANQFQQSMDGTISRARAYLERHIKRSLEYLRKHPGELGSMPGAGTHGRLYRAARGEWFQRGAQGELRQEGRDLQGWMQQEVNRGGGYYHSAPSYDTGHYVAGVDIPENFRWELSVDNRRRPHAARRYNLPPTYY
jgi:uncharacterized protein YoxC